MKGYKLQEGDVILLKEEHGVGALGKYVVYKTSYDGGGTGHGPHDVYPDGHHVWCESIYNSKARVDFYQTGCFRNMIAPGTLMPIARARREWVLSPL